MLANRSKSLPLAHGLRGAGRCRVATSAAEPSRQTSLRDGPSSRPDRGLKPTANLIRPDGTQREALGSSARPEIPAASHASSCARHSSFVIRPPPPHFPRPLSSAPPETPLWQQNLRPPRLTALSTSLRTRFCARDGATSTNRHGTLDNPGRGGVCIGRACFRRGHGRAPRHRTRDRQSAG